MFFYQSKEKAGSSETQEPPPKSEPAAEQEHSEEGRGQEDEEEEDLLGKFEKELEDIFLPKSEMAKLKEEVKSEMEKEFDNIIDEVRSCDKSWLPNPRSWSQASPYGRHGGSLVF